MTGSNDRLVKPKNSLIRRLKYRLGLLTGDPDRVREEGLPASRSLMEPAGYRQVLKAGFSHRKKAI